MNPPKLRLNLVSDTAAIAPVRKTVEAFAEAVGFGDKAVFEIGLCLNEALANVIVHAYGSAPDRPIEVAVDVDGGRMDLTLRDWGDGRVPDLRRDPPTDPDDAAFRPGGLGLPCLKRLLDGLSFEPLPDGMRLRLTKLKR